MSSSKRTVKNGKSKAPSKVVKGRGSYISDWWKQNRGQVPRQLGRFLGGMAGAPDLGQEFGAAISKNLLGWGDYAVPWKIASNSLMSSGSVPVVHNAGESGFEVTHQEYIGTVLSTTGFVNTVYQVNPGMSATFPWLAKIASNFQQYSLMGAVVTFKSALTNAVATFSSLGSVIIAADLNSAASPAPNRTAMEQMQFVAACKPNEDFVAPIECSPVYGGRLVRYVRIGAVPATASINDYDHCSLQVATTGQPSSGVELGRLYITYHIRLLNPKLVSAAGSYAHVRLTEPSATLPFGSGLTAPVFKINTLGIELPQTAGAGWKTIRVPAGTTSGLFVTMNVVDSSGMLSPTTNVMSLVNMIKGGGEVTPTDGREIFLPTGGTGSPIAVGYQCYLQIVDPTLDATVEFKFDSFPSHVGSVGDLWVMPIVPASNNLSCNIRHAVSHELIKSDVEAPPMRVEPPPDELGETPVVVGAAAGAPTPVARLVAGAATAVTRRF